jgi:hypothetical protein
MSGQIVQVRLLPKHTRPLLGNSESYLDYIFGISNSSYSFHFGVDIDGEDNIL